MRVLAPGPVPPSAATRISSRFSSVFAPSVAAFSSTAALSPPGAEEDRWLGTLEIKGIDHVNEFVNVHFKIFHSFTNEFIMILKWKASNLGHQPPELTTHHRLPMRGSQHPHLRAVATRYPWPRIPSATWRPNCRVGTKKSTFQPSS